MSSPTRERKFYRDEPYERRRPERRRDFRVYESRVQIFVSNVPEQMREEELLQLFDSPVNVRIVNTASGKRIAFVKFSHPRDQRRALHLTLPHLGIRPRKISNRRQQEEDDERRIISGRRRSRSPSE